jgi:hypothetical protein
MKSIFRIFSVVIVLVLGLAFGCGGKQAGIEGKMVDGKGQPMSGIKVIAKQVQPIKGYEQFETTTGSDGVFKFKGLFPASEYSIFPSADKWKTSAKVTAKSGPEGQTSMLPSPMTIRFTSSNDGIITDSQLGLQWAPAPDQPMNWSQATDYVQNLSLGGGGWRLPTRSELKSIHNKEMKGGVDPAFHIINDNWVWTSETERTDLFGLRAWYFDFKLGKEFQHSPVDPYPGYRALAVRSPK